MALTGAQASLLDRGDNKSYTPVQQKQILSNQKPTGNPVSYTAPQKAQAIASQVNNGGQTQQNNPPLIPQPQQPSIDFDALIKPALDAYDQAIAPLQQSSEADIQGITNSAAQQKVDTQQNITGQTNTINQAQQQQRTNENSAADEARRQYSEVQQGIQARYGGTTGTGAFATEYAGGNAVRSIANIHAAAMQAQQGLTDKLLQVQEVGRTALHNIETNAQDQIQKARAQLELGLSAIRQGKAGLQVDKAKMAANAMQNYQDTVNQVNAQNTQFKQQLYQQQQAAQIALQNKLASAQAITSGANAQDMTGNMSGITGIIKDNPNIDVTGTIKSAYGGPITLSTRKKSDTSSGDNTTGGLF